MSLFSDFNEVKGLISREIVVREYDSDWLEAYIPSVRSGYITTKLRQIARELEEKYSRPVHVYISKNRCMIKLK